MRITGGVHRSRTLVAPRGQATRPTSDRVREALFSILASEGAFDADSQANPRVLDLYAGSGALGFEALSRGAREVVFVEDARPAVAAIRENLDALDLEDQVTVLAMRVERALDGARELTPASFDLVFLDPPYALVTQPQFAEVLQKSARLLDAAGILVLEHDSSDSDRVPSADAIVLDRQRRYGDTTLSLYRSRFRILGPDAS